MSRPAARYLQEFFTPSPIARFLKGRSYEAGSRRMILRHLGAYSAVLALLALLSWLGRGWGHFVLYGLVLATFALLVAVVSLGVAWISRSRGTSRARAFLARSLRSFAYAQITLAAAIVATVVLARLTSGPLGPYPGGAFEGVASEEPFEEDLVIERAPARTDRRRSTLSLIRTRIAESAGSPGTKHGDSSADPP